MVVFRVEVRQGVFPSQMKTAVAQGSCLLCCCCRWTRFPLTLFNGVLLLALHIWSFFFWGEYWQLYWHLLAGKLIQIRGGKKINKTTTKSRPSGWILPCSQTTTGQTQPKVWVTAQGQLWPGRESRCAPSPSLTNTVDRDCSHLPFLRFLAHSDFAGFVHFPFHAGSRNSQKGRKKWIPPECLPSGITALRVRTAPNKDQHPLSQPGCRCITLPHLQNHQSCWSVPVSVTALILRQVKTKPPGCGLVWEVTHPAQSQPWCGVCS